MIQNLLEYKDKVGRYILSSEKCKYAQAIIEVFPNLKNPVGNLGDVSVFCIIFILITILTILYYY